MTSKKVPWPTKDVMEQIYREHLWGGHDQEFYSGEGSHLSEIVSPYVSEVRSFLTAFDQRITV
ncbi:MAG: hypothetical protein Salg2KO_05540 [Salibacteraceae bacterium]